MQAFNLPWSLTWTYGGVHGLIRVTREAGRTRKPPLIIDVKLSSGDNFPGSVLISPEEAQMKGNANRSSVPQCMNATWRRTSKETPAATSGTSSPFSCRSVALSVSGGSEPLHWNWAHFRSAHFHARRGLMTSAEAGSCCCGGTEALLFLQGNRDESYLVDEDLAEQDATALFEVRFGFEGKPGDDAETETCANAGMRRLERAALGRTNPPSATSWPPGTTCSFKLRSRYTSRCVCAVPVWTRERLVVSITRESAGMTGATGPPQMLMSSSAALWNWNPGRHRQRDDWNPEEMLHRSGWGRSKYLIRAGTAACDPGVRGRVFLVRVKTVVLLLLQWGSPKTRSSSSPGGCTTPWKEWAPTRTRWRASSCVAPR